MTLEGGCLCGAVRYVLDEEPFDSGYCHCRMCQRASGAPAMVFASVHRDKVRITKGASRKRRSSDHGERWHCAECGTPLFMFEDDFPDILDVAVVTLDAPEARGASVSHLAIERAFVVRHQGQSSTVSARKTGRVRQGNACVTAGLVMKP